MSEETVRILIVDDEQDVREPMAQFLRSEGYDVRTAGDGVEALERMAEMPADIVLSDVRMPRLDGMELLQRLRSEYPDTSVIMFTAYGTEASAVAAIKAGASEYVLKPVVFEDMQQKILRVWDEARARRSRASSSRPGAGRAPAGAGAGDESPGDARGGTATAADERTEDAAGVSAQAAPASALEAILGRSPQIEALKRFVARVARAGSPALIHGESGTGKELVARALHELSTRRDEPFVAINCAAIPEQLLESEFFGHRRGAFTGAVADKPGLFETAGAGTIFLDEVAELPMPMQAKLLRALEEREVTPVGDTRPVPVRATVVAASARRLQDEVEAGRFRLDLYFRINVIEIEVPPLRERRGDARFLAEAFLRQARERLLTEAERFSEAALEAIDRYGWPGNVRELRNVVERAAVLARGREIELADLPDAVVSGAAATPSRRLRDAVRAFERDYIVRTLRDCGGDKRAAADVLGIGLSSLYRKLDEYGIE